MNSAHPDFQHLANHSMSDSDLLERLRADPPEAVKTLNGEIIDLDSARGTCRFRFEIVPAFCHSPGRICPGGFLTGDLRDEKGRLIVHATSTIKIVRSKKA